MEHPFKWGRKTLNKSTHKYESKSEKCYKEKNNIKEIKKQSGGYFIFSGQRRPLSEGWHLNNDLRKKGNEP